MNVTVSKLYDIDAIVVAPQMLSVSVDENCSKEACERLSLRFAKESDESVVKKGDTVFCSADEESYKDKRTIIIFTSTPLPGAEKASEAVLEKTVGDTVLCELCEKSVKLKINRILRRTPVKVDDSVISLLKIEGVNTVSEYEVYVKEKAIANQKTERTKEINRFVIDELVNKSEFLYDEKEMESYAKSEYDAFKEQYGDEITEAYEDIRDSIVFSIKQSFLAEAFCKSKGIEIDEKAAEEETDNMLEMMSLMGEALPEREEMLQMTIQNMYLMELFTYIENKYAEKVGG